MNDKAKHAIDTIKDFQREQRIEAAKITVQEREDSLKEAKEHADKAFAHDVPEMSVSEKSPEVVRTETLVRDAEKKLYEAKKDLKDLEENKGQPTADTQAPIPAENV